jgi:hypothetical protein
VAEILEWFWVAEREADVVVESAGDVGSLAFDAGVERCSEGIVDYAYDGFLVDGQAEGDADVRVAVEEVCGSVYGVDDEGGCVGEGEARVIGFFADEPGDC